MILELDVPLRRFAGLVLAIGILLFEDSHSVLPFRIPASRPLSAFAFHQFEVEILAQRVDGR